MSYSGSGGGKRLRTSPSEAEGSPRRRRGSPSVYSPSLSPYRSPSPLPSPSTYRSPSHSPSPCRSWSQRPSSEDGADDLSRSRGSDDVDAHGRRPAWRPHANKELGEHGRTGEYSVRIDDYDRLFTCRACRRMLSPPVYQCPFAHVTCSRCHEEVGDNRCSCCGSGNGYGRNRVVEEFLGRIRFSCRNKVHDCEAFLPHHEMREHEQTCRHEPIFCPVSQCGFASRAVALTTHLTLRHHWDTIRFHYDENFRASALTSTIFQSRDDGELFFLDSFSEGRGIALSMICIRPENAREQEFVYELKTPVGNGDRRPWLQMQSTARNTSLRHGLGEKEKVFLLVPKDLPGTEDGNVEVCIRKLGHQRDSV